MRNQPLRAACGHCGQEIVTLGEPCRECQAVTDRLPDGRLEVTAHLVINRVGRRIISDRLFDAVLTVGVYPFA
jgi:hypothetical protein